MVHRQSSFQLIYSFSMAITSPLKWKEPVILNENDSNTQDKDSHESLFQHSAMPLSPTEIHRACVLIQDLLSIHFIIKKKKRLNDSFEIQHQRSKVKTFGIYLPILSAEPGSSLSFLEYPSLQCLHTNSIGFEKYYNWSILLAMKKKKDWR